ncbi:MAG: purine-nucleoside phosphorylase [Ignavibacteriae bacterium]|nr:purine-nucleoside phosphorylase [Ignavibacteriota bacterium]
MIDLEFKYKNLVDYLKSEIPFTPEISLILGSGLGDFAEKINIEKSISTKDIPDYPISTVEGHKGFLHFAKIFDKNVLIFQGRIHFYEGYEIDKCIIPSFISSQLNVKKLLATNAAGGVNPNFSPGDLMLVTGFISQNILKEISNVLAIPTTEQKNFIHNLPSKKFNEIIRNASLEEKVLIKEGTYWFNKGPTYETPAEIIMQKKFGADAVGMSTVHEAIFAAYHGIEVSAISLITNYAAGLSPQKLSHKEVMETADLAKEKFERLVKRIIKFI